MVSSANPTDTQQKLPQGRHLLWEALEGDWEAQDSGQLELGQGSFGLGIRERFNP